MARNIDREPDTAYTEFDRGFYRAFVGLWKLVNGKQLPYRFSGYSVKWNQGGYICVVRAFHTLSKRRFVVFGSGDSHYDSVRNASLAVGKQQWKPDKYAGSYGVQVG